MMQIGILLMGMVLFMSVNVLAMSQRIGIGAVFDEEDFRQYNTIFQEGLANSKLPMQNKVYVNAVSTFLDSSTSIYTSFLALCQTVDNLDIRAFLVVGRQETIQRTSLVARHLGIPVLAYTTESLVERHVQAHSSQLLMLKPSQTDQADAYLKLFQANFWFNVIIIVQDALAADGFYEQMKSKTQADAKWNVAFKIMPETISDVSLFSIFTSLLGNEPKIVVIHADLLLVMRIFKYVAVGNFTSVNHAWFITDSSFTRDHNYLGVFPSGTFSVIHNYVSNTDDVVLDGTNFLIKSVIQSSDRAYIPRSCWSNDTRSSTTPISDYMYRILKSTILTGRSGDIKFDNQGKLDASNFIVQHLVREDGQSSFWRRIGYIHGDDVSPFGIVWPGESLTNPISFGRKKYRVVTNPVKPFVMDIFPHPDYGYCATETPCVYINNTGRDNVIRALKDYENGTVNSSNPYVLKCCRGLSVDLLNRLARDLDFDYDLYIVADTTYGKEVNGTWNGMIRELMTGTAHMAVAAFSITRDRVRVIDFSSIYFFSGFSILYTEKQRASNMQAFLDPFAPSVWFAILIGATLTAIAMGIFEWNSPFGLNPWGKKRKQNYTLGSGMTMVYSVLFGHTVKTKSPKAWPSKVMQNLWASSCIFVIASYTANLAAFIAGKHAGIIYRSVHDSWLLDINVGVLPGSAVEGIVKKLSPKLYTKSQKCLVDTTDNAINKLIGADLDAYLGDYPILDYARAKLDPDCKLRLLTQTFGEDGYGIGLPKGSPLKTPLSEKINGYHESGYIDDLIDVHFADSRCYKQRIKSEDSRLEEQHHAGSFVMLCVGMVAGLIVLFLEHAIFKWLVPKLRKRPGHSFWKSVHVMFFSQRLHRAITSAELVPIHETYREMLGIMKSRDFIKFFQKNTIKTNKMADAAKRKRLNRNFFDIIEKAKWMKQMQDNHLFGDDTSQMSLTPDIREVSLRNISQAVDLEEFRKQNQLENLCHLDDIVIPRRQAKTDETEFKCSFTNLNDGFNWSFPNSDSHEINARPSSSDTLYDTNKKRCNGMESALNDSDEFGPFITGTLDTNSFNCPVFEVGSYPSPVMHSDKRYSRSEEHVYEVPAGSISDCNHKPKITSNGDAFSNIIKPKTKMLSFAQEPFLTTDNSSEASSVATCDVVQQRRLSIPETKQKDSRTFHPRKRQTIHGNRRGRSQTAFKVDKFSKEELLLMWKSSELELNDKLHADVKDKQRHDTKLNSPKIQMSTEV